MLLIFKQISFYYIELTLGYTPHTFEEGLAEMKD